MPIIYPPVSFGDPTFTGTIDLAGTTKVGKSLQITSDISPAQLTADVANYTATGIEDSSILRITSNGLGTWSIGGFVGGADGRILIVENVGSSTFNLLHENSGSTAANRIILARSTTLPVSGGQAVVLAYDATSSRWRQVAHEILSASNTVIRTGTSSETFISPGGAYDSLAEVVLGYSSTTIVTSGDSTLDMSKFINAGITLTQNSTLPNPTNPRVGKTGRIRGVQDSTGGRTLAFGGNWKWPNNNTPTAPTTANAVFFIDFEVVSETYIRAVMTSMV